MIRKNAASRAPGCRPWLTAVGLLAALLMRGAGAAAPAAAEPTAADAADFLAGAEAALDRENEYLNRAAWVQATDITSDTNWLLAKANAQATDLTVRYAKEAARFDHLKLDEVSARKLYLLKQSLVLPASSRPGASQALADIAARLDTDYSTAKFSYSGRLLTLDDMEDILRTSRDPQETRTLWRAGAPSRRRR